MEGQVTPSWMLKGAARGADVGTHVGPGAPDQALTRPRQSADATLPRGTASLTVRLPKPGNVMPSVMCAVLLLQVPVVDSAVLRHADGLVPPVATAVRVERAPVIDGRLDEPGWLLATPVTQFLQTDPEEGKPVSESTEEIGRASCRERV